MRASTACVCVCTCVRTGGWGGMNQEYLLKKGCLGDQPGPLHTCLFSSLPVSLFRFKGAPVMIPKLFEEKALFSSAARSWCHRSPFHACHRQHPNEREQRSQTLPVLRVFGGGGGERGRGNTDREIMNAEVQRAETLRGTIVLLPKYKCAFVRCVYLLRELLSGGQLPEYRAMKWCYSFFLVSAGWMTSHKGKGAENSAHTVNPSLWLIHFV